MLRTQAAALMQLHMVIGVDKGGVAVLWKKAIAGVTPIDGLEHERVCGVRLQSSSGQVINILSVYMPAKGCEGDLEECLDELGGILETREDGSLTIVCGDLNGDMGCLGGPRNPRQPDSRGRLVHRFAESYDLIAANVQESSRGPINTFYGPFSESCIDYCLIPGSLVNSIITCTTNVKEALNTSDHLPICIDINLGSLEKCYTEINPPSKLKWGKISEQDLFNKYTLPVSEKLYQLCDLIESHTPDGMFIDGCFETMCNILRQGEKCIPTSNFKKNLKPFWCPELDSLKRHKVECHNRWVSAGRPRGRGNHLWCEHSDAEKAFRKRLKRISKEYDEDVL